MLAHRPESRKLEEKRALSSISVESRFRGAPGHGNSLAMAAVSGFGGEQVAAQDWLAVGLVDAAGEAAQVSPQVFEKAFQCARHS